jgi:7-cyano-7-deazaguanine reductase
MGHKPPLGEATEYDSLYSPELLHSIPRAENRSILGLSDQLPFRGEDVWNAYELTWLDARGKPRVAVAEFRVPFDSPNIIESKSMKLYLNSLSMRAYIQSQEVQTVLESDLTEAAGAEVSVRLKPVSKSPVIREFSGVCLDDIEADCRAVSVDPQLLDCAADGETTEVLFSHLLRSLCPVTGQPDLGSIVISYTGRPIERASLLRYIVSYRNHNDFHESCAERFFLDIKTRCQPDRLSVYARYNRRGGIDINPFRSDFESTAENLRLWRQ